MDGAGTDTPSQLRYRSFILYSTSLPLSLSLQKFKHKVTGPTAGAGFGGRGLDGWSYNGYTLTTQLFPTFLL